MVLIVLNSLKVEQLDLHHGKQEQHWIHCDSHISVLSIGQSQDDSAYNTHDVVCDVHICLDWSCGVDDILDLPKDVLSKKKQSPHSYVVVSSIPEIIEVTPSKEALLPVDNSVFVSIFIISEEIIFHTKKVSDQVFVFLVQRSGGA
jgi:hypothetical protein